MEAAKGHKVLATKNELMQHVDLISNPKVKAYIAKKKQIRFEKKREVEIRSGVIGKYKNLKASVLESESESEEEDEENQQMEVESESE